MSSKTSSKLSSLSPHGHKSSSAQERPLSYRQRLEEMKQEIIRLSALNFDNTLRQLRSWMADNK